MGDALPPPAPPLPPLPAAADDVLTPEERLPVPPTEDDTLVPEVVQGAEVVPVLTPVVVAPADEVAEPVAEPVLPLPELLAEDVGEALPVAVPVPEPPVEEAPVVVAEPPVEELPAAVVVASVLPQGVVGLAVTQLHMAWTEVTTCRAVFRPQPSVTQARAAAWMSALLEHWHA